MSINLSALIEVAATGEICKICRLFSKKNNHLPSYSPSTSHLETRLQICKFISNKNDNLASDSPSRIKATWRLAYKSWR